MGIFSGFGNAPTWGASEYLKPGQYQFEVDEIKVVASQKHKGRSYFIASFKVLASTVPEHTPGKIVAWNVNMANGEMAMSDIKGFALALLPDLEGDTPEEQEKAMDALINDEQPAKGMRIDCNAWNVVAKSTGNDFTKTKWSPVTD